MNRRILLLNIALAALVALLAWQFRTRRLQAEARERAVLLKAAHAQTVLAPPPPAPVPPVVAAEYNDTVQKMLFAKDRSPNVIVEVPPPAPPPPPPPPVPPLPLYFGQLRFGGDPEVILSPANGQGQKGYTAGESLGDFKVVSFDRDKITFDWKGQVVERNLTDLKPKEAPRQLAPVAAAAPPPPPRPAGVISIGAASSDTAASNAPPSNVPSVLGTASGGGFYNCRSDDSTPSGTIVGGYKKTSAQGLMGATCRWEQVK